jgi:hypothetical protein
MRQFLLSSFLIALLISSTSNAQNESTPHGTSTQLERKYTNKVSSGFYLEIKRSYVRAYSGWQKKTISLLRVKGLVAFNGEPQNQIYAGNVSNVESMERTTKPRSIISAVYVGPYQSRALAEDMMPKLLSALKPLIDEEKKTDELNNRHLFLVGVVRVR